MGNVAVGVENLAKKFKLGNRRAVSFREQFNNVWTRQPPSVDFLALDDVTFEVGEGETLGIIGKNGAGKSTLLKILSRITWPTSGKVEIFGRVSSLLEVGTGFHPELSGRENIYLNGTILGMRRAEVKAKFDEIVAFSGVERFIDTPIKHYSSGMKVRLAFSVAAHLEPEILIIDEVLAVGDAEFQKKCLGKMEDVAGQGRTVLFVSHNMVQVQALCRRGIVLEQGKISFDGPTIEAVGFYFHGLNGLNTSIDVYKMPRAGVKHDSFTILTAQIISNNEANVLNEKDTLSITLSFRLSERIEGLILGFTLSDPVSGTLVECRSTATFPKLTLDIGEYKVGVTSHLRLKAGSYSLNVGARSNKGHLEYIPSISVVNIGDVTESGFAEWSKPSSGVVITESVWELMK